MASTNGTSVAEESVQETRMRRRREARVEAHRQRSNHDRLLNEFQPDAVELERQPVAGGARWTLYVVVAFIGAFIYWANWAEIDKLVKAEGHLLTTVPPVVIDTKLTSPIKSLHFKFGDRVKAGELLATLDPTFSAADLAALEAQIKSLDSKKARLRAEKEWLPFQLVGHEDDHDWIVQYRLYLERKKQYESEIRKFEAQQTSLQVQLENTKLQEIAQRENWTKYRKYEEKIKDLASRGSKSATDVLSRELQSTEAKMQVMTSNARMKELKKSMESIVAEQEAYIAGWRTEVVSELADVNDQMNSLLQERNKAIRSNEFVNLRVPDHLPYKEFMVLEMAEKSVGSTVQPGEPLCKLVPLGAAMEVEVEVDGKDIAVIASATDEQIATGELPEGSEVRIKLASFPYQKHGTLDGVIRTISEGSFEKQSSNGTPLGITNYRARIQILDPHQLENVGENFRLMPGMTATAEIKVGRRKVMEYFLYPLLRYMDESLKER